MSTSSTSAYSATSSDFLGKFSLVPHADIILRSCDFHDFRVQKLYVTDSSPILGAQIMAAVATSCAGVALEGRPCSTNCLPKNR